MERSRRRGKGERSQAGPVLLPDRDEPFGGDEVEVLERLPRKHGQSSV